jgi:hypothetical protein
VTATELAGLSRRELMEVMQQGHAIDPDALDDTEYRGVSLGLPKLLERLTWKTFKKVFHRDPTTGELRGWNVRIDQRSPDDYRPKTKRGVPVTFGHFEVVSASGYDMPHACDRGLMLDYGRGRHKRFEPTAALRDPIVAIDAGSVDLLLGWSYVELPVGRVGTPSFFSLERDRPLSFIPS